MERSCVRFTKMPVIEAIRHLDQRAIRKPTGFSPWVRRAIFSCIKNNSLLSTISEPTERADSKFTAYHTIFSGDMLALEAHGL